MKDRVDPDKRPRLRGRKHPRLHGLALKAWLLPLAVSIMWLFPSPGPAANHDVTNLNNSGAGSLRAAIAAAVDSDTITIDPGLSGTLTLTSALPDLNSVTFVNGANITLSRTTGNYNDTPLAIADGKTVSGTLPSLSAILSADASYSNTIWGRGSFTLSTALSEVITSRGTDGAYGMVAMGSMSMNDISSSISSTSTANGGAYGIYTLNSSISLNDLTGRIDIDGARSGYGMSARTTLSMQDLTGTINVLARGHDGCGLRTEQGAMSLNNITGTIDVEASSSAYGLSAWATIALNNITGTVTAKSTGHSVYGLRSNGDISFNDITGTGTVSAETANNFAYAFYGDNISLNAIAGTISAKASGNDAFALFSETNMSLNTLSGTISAEAGGTRSVGLYSLGTLDNGAGGAVAISGSVTAQANGLAVGIGADNGLNLNVSGTIRATDLSGTGKAYAIAAGRADDNVWVTGGNVDDTVSIASGTTLRGNIELGGGTNVLTMDGAGTLNGGISNVTTMTKSSAGTWDVSGTITTGTLDLQAGKLALTVNQGGSPTVDASGTVTNNGEIAFTLGGVIMGAGNSFKALSSPNALAGGGSYSMAPHMYFSMTQGADNISFTKARYADMISANSDAMVIAQAFDSGNPSAGSDLEAVMLELETATTANELEEKLSNFNGFVTSNISALSTNTAQLFSTATQVRMAEMRAYQTMLADSGEPDPGDPDSWPMVAANGNLTGLFARSPEIKPNGIHLRVLGRTGDMNSHDGYDGYDYNTFALSGGYDRVIGDEVLIGISGGYALTDASYKDDGGSDSRLESYTVGAYGSWFKNDWFVDATLAAAYNKYDITREIPLLSRTATSAPEGYTVSGKTSVGQRFVFGHYALTPMASLEYTRFHQESYAETGAGAVNLVVDSTESNFLESGIGARIDRTCDTAFGRIIPEISAMWMHEWLTQKRDITYSMAGMPGTVIPTTTAEGANDSLRFSAGLRAFHDDGMALTLRYQGEVERHAGSHSLMFEAQFVF